MTDNNNRCSFSFSILCFFWVSRVPSATRCYSHLVFLKCSHSMFQSNQGVKTRKWELAKQEERQVSVYGGAMLTSPSCFLLFFFLEYHVCLTGVKFALHHQKRLNVEHNLLLFYGFPLLLFFWLYQNSQTYCHFTDVCRYLKQNYVYYSLGNYK